MFQGDLRYKLPVSASHLRGLPVIPQKDMQDHIIVACIEVMAVRRPPGGIAVYFDIPAVVYSISEGNTGLLKIWTCLQVPTSWRVHKNFSPVQRAQWRRAPTLIEPQAPYQLFWNGALPGGWRFGDPGTCWHHRIEGVPGHYRSSLG